MDKPLRTYIGSEGIITEFPQNEKLLTKPISSILTWSFTPAEYLVHVGSSRLYQDGNLEGVVVDHTGPQYTNPEKRGFWSNGIINQEEMAEYIREAANSSQEHKDNKILRTGQLLENLAYRMSERPLQELPETNYIRNVEEFIFREAETNRTDAF